MNNFRIIISMTSEQVIFEDAKTMIEVDRVISRHLANTPKCITVYELNKGNDYRIIDRIKPEEPKAVTVCRPIGFGRW